MNHLKKGNNLMPLILSFNQYVKDYKSLLVWLKVNLQAEYNVVKYKNYKDLK